MDLIDLILNLAGLLLWFNWRSMRFDPLARRKPATLAGTLKSTQKRSAGVNKWVFLAALPVLLLARAALYWQIGAPAEWIPRLDLGLVVLAFPIEKFNGALLFSVASFLRMAMIAFFWLVTIVILTRQVEEADPILKLVRIQVGRLWRMPLWMQVTLPFLVTVCLWAILRPVLSAAGIVGQAHSALQVLQQGMLLSGSLLVSLKLLLPVLLVLYMLTSYVYLGSNPVWDFVTATSRGLLVPFRYKPVGSSKLDFAPLIAIVLILLLLHTLPLLGMRFADAQNIIVWPE